MEPSTADTKWPVEMLGRILHFLAIDGASISWQKLAYLTHKNRALSVIARRMERPLVLRVEFDPGIIQRKFIIPFLKATVARIEIDWGDDSPLQVINDSVKDQYVEHDYNQGGLFTVRVFPHGAAGANGRWLDHLGWDRLRNVAPQECWWAPLRSFDSLGSLGIRSLQALFFRAYDFNMPLSLLDVSGVDDMAAMFCLAESFNQPISNWNVSNVTNMSQMFEYCGAFNQPIGEWNVSRVENMETMFSFNKRFNQPLGDWDTSQVHSMRRMFFSCDSFNQDISRWDVSRVMDMESMFYGAKSFNQPINGWNVSKVANFSSMFASAESFNQDIGAWKMRQAIKLHAMFKNAINFDRRFISHWTVSGAELF